MRARQSRFIVGAIGGWTASRFVALWPGTVPVAGVIGGAAVGVLLLPWTPNTTPGFTPVPPAAVKRTFASRVPAEAAKSLEVPPFLESPLQAETRRLTAIARELFPQRAQAVLRHARFAAPERSGGDLAPFPAAPPSSTPVARRSRWFGSAYLFMRPGSGSAGLAAGGTLGASQAGARIGYVLDAEERWAVVGRVYRPLTQRGGEAAVGIDWRPAAGLRLSAERRIGLDRDGRDAWSIYAAHGFYHEKGGVIVEGYGQAGVVGAKSRDLFADAVVRAGRRVRLAGLDMTAGAGVWGAAQPGVARLDIGPRVAATLPVANRAVVLALEGRLRIAGDARPGSGAALTIGTDF